MLTESVLLCTEDCPISASCRGSTCNGLPKRSVSFAWGADVDYPWPVGRTLSTYDTGVDDAVFVMFDEFSGASVDVDDDPSYEQAVKGNDSQKWADAREEDIDNLRRFNVIQEIPADEVPAPMKICMTP